MPGINKLAPTRVARLNKRGRYSDGAGLWLSVSTSGSKSWVFQFTMHGKERQLGIGSLKSVSLANARIKARKLRTDVEAGIDPIAEKRASRQAAIVQATGRVTFKEAATDYIDAHAPGWKNGKSKEQWTASLETYAFPIIGKIDVAGVDTAMILKILKPIWSTKSETAGRVRGRIKAILDAAKAAGHRSGDNPAAWEGHLVNLLPKLSKVKAVRPMPAMPFEEMPAFMRDLAKRPGISARALEVLILTATRTGSLIGMRDDELDFKEKIWTIPGSRMKGGKEFVVPLTDRAIAILKAIPREKGNPHLFAGARRGSHISNMSMLATMKHAAPLYVCHGFRSSFNDWAAETTSTPHFVIEMALSHAIESKTERAYRRGDLLDKRRLLMAEWEAFLYPPASTPRSESCAPGSRSYRRNGSRGR
jgi:integrase